MYEPDEDDEPGLESAESVRSCPVCKADFLKDEKHTPDCPWNPKNVLGD